MARQPITLERDDLGFFSTNDIGADALDAIKSIPGTSDVRIENESEGQVEISYECAISKKIWNTQECLSKFNLRRVEKNSEFD